MPRIRLRYFGPQGQPLQFESDARSVTVGSHERCDLRLPGLGPIECTIYLSEQGYYARDDGGRLSIDGVAGPGFVRTNDVLAIGDTVALRFEIVPDSPPAAMGPSPGGTAARRDLSAVPLREEVARRAPRESSYRTGDSRRGGTPSRGRTHSPVLAAILSLVFPGAGQAYNGQPVKAFFVLLLAALVVPWLLGIWDAHRTAARIDAEGGRTAGGGPWGVILHGWLTLDLALLVLVVLTVMRVLI